MSLGKRAMAEFFGTFWLVFGGCGAAVLDAAFPNLGIGFLGVALAFGLTVLTMAFAIGQHFGMPFESSDFVRAGGGEAISGEGSGAVRGGAGGRRDLRGGGTVHDRARERRIQPGKRLRLEWLWRTFAGRLHAGGMLHGRGGADHVFPVHHYGSDVEAGGAGIRAPGDRVGTDADSPGGDSGDEFVGRIRRGARARRFLWGWAVAQLWMFWAATILGVVL